MSLTTATGAPEAATEERGHNLVWYMFGTVGLYASIKISQGDMVTKMENPKIISATTTDELVTKWSKKAVKKILPEGSGVYLNENNGRKRLVYDIFQVDSDGTSVPLWFRMSHSASEPNVRPEWTENGEMLFIASEDISVDSELKLNYGYPGSMMYV